ncbi:MAG: hypothetical protein AB9903_05165 [Vulcanimicrobiota bacterium]
MSRLLVTMLIFVSLCLALVIPAWAQNVSLEGHQTRGRGTDGTLKCSGLNLTVGGTIVGAADSGAGFWLKGPNGIVIRNLTAGNSKGTVLSAGNWYAYPYLPENKDDAAVVILIKPLGGASVPPSTGSGSRCLNTGCGSFNTYVPINHQHSHKCLDTDCGAFNTYVSINHQHCYNGNAAASTPLSVSITASPRTPSIGEETSFTVIVQGGTPPYQYDYYRDGVKRENLCARSSKSKDVISWTPSKPSSVTCAVRVTDSAGRMKEGSTTVNVKGTQGASSTLSLVGKTTCDPRPINNRFTHTCNGVNLPAGGTIVNVSISSGIVNFNLSDTPTNYRDISVPGSGLNIRNAVGTWLRPGTYYAYPCWRSGLNSVEIVITIRPGPAKSGDHL